MPIDPLIGYGLISGVGSLASSIYGSITGQKQSKDLMDYQYQLQQKMIESERAYNSPQAQMERLAMAHLNPNLVYGSGVTGNQTSAGSVGLSNRNARFDNPLQDLATGYLNSKQLQLQEIQTRNAAFESRERQLKLRAETLGQLLNNDLVSATMDSQIKQKAQDLINSMTKNDLMTQQINNAKIAANNLIEQGNNLAARTNLTKEQALTEVVKRRAIEKGIELNSKQIDLIGAQIPYINSGEDLRKLAYEIQKATFGSSGGAANKWLSEHPTVSTIVGLLEKLLGIGGQVTDIIP